MSVCKNVTAKLNVVTLTPISKIERNARMAVRNRSVRWSDGLNLPLTKQSNFYYGELCVLTWHSSPTYDKRLAKRSPQGCDEDQQTVPSLFAISQNQVKGTLFFLFSVSIHTNQIQNLIDTMTTLANVPAILQPKYVFFLYCFTTVFFLLLFHLFRHNWSSIRLFS